MRSILVSFLSCILILVFSNSFARDKQPRRFNSTNSFEKPAQSTSTPLKSKPKLSVDERLQRLERLVNSQGLVNLLLKLEELQKEAKQLRGDVETQTHLVSELKKRQRDLYVDIDRRMLQIERNGSSSKSQNSVLPQSSVLPKRSGQQEAVTGLAQSPPTKLASPVPASTSSKPINSVQEQKAYLKAFDLLRELRYEQAIKAYRQFIKEYPNGRYAHIAQYWLSEASYAQRDFKQAILDYNVLVKDYPNSPKLAEAMLKIGYSYNELGNNKAARDIIEKLIRVYPNTTAAGQGQNLLKKIKSKKR